MHSIYQLVGLSIHSVSLLLLVEYAYSTSSRNATESMDNPTSQQILCILLYQEYCSYSCSMRTGGYQVRMHIYSYYSYHSQYTYYCAYQLLASSSMHTMHTTLVVCNIILSLEYNTQCAYYESTSYQLEYVVRILGQQYAQHGLLYAQYLSTYSRFTQ